MKISLIFLASFLCLGLFSASATAQKKPKKLPRVCGNPDQACKGRANFRPYELPVEWPENAVIAESEPFYAIILKSARFDHSSATNCEEVYSESEIQSIQYLFPTNKVFALKCVDPGYNYYTGIGYNYVFIAVYAGKTRAEANRFLKRVLATGEFPGVKLRRMRVGINGT